MNDDTIAAVATPPGRGGVGVIRISGPLALSIGQAVAGPLPRPRYAAHRLFRDAEGESLDDGLILIFPGPCSYTGEDIVELQGHGGPVVLDAILERVCTLGARLARPGEFTERAFLNGRLDLAQAEAVADLIDAASRQAAKAARASLAGSLSRPVAELGEAMIRLRVQVEAGIDFPDEEIELVADTHLHQDLERVRAALAALRAQARQGQLLRDGMTVVIAGPPNAGKSSLLNALAQRETAIVTDIPGTTRDVLREYLSIDGLPLHVVDTAGLRDTQDVVEAEGIRRAWAAIETADRLLWVEDSGQRDPAALAALRGRLPAGLAVTIVDNKIDLTGEAPGLSDERAPPRIRLSARTGEGLDALRTHLKSVMGFDSAGEGGFSARRRHLEAMDRAAGLLDEVAGHFTHNQPELAAEGLRLAHEALGEITGRVSADALLGHIFSSFCIGK